ncbi:class I SAM-dependent methyltransferase [Sphingobium nicotianae]|uniref:Methyltransferase n=1 Tax=Sphingobium nicotianae TaxID=2782607 RepID=A0A9X1DCZ6_9SPHN|nr:methyltransferase [Sphingobium nicotianae]MBT2187610.1 methyltransferase [Sphingobium nicotianae]
MTRTTLRYAFAVTLMATSGAVIAASAVVNLKTVLADPGRPDADKVRDADRKPAELIAFAGVKAGSTVAELGPGGGYFTRILTGAVGAKGHVYAMVGRPSPVLSDYAATHANLSVVSIQPGEINVPAPVDVVWTTLNYHDFKNNKVGDSDVAALTNAAAFKALKPGGVYFIVDHQAAPGAGTSVTSTLHRIEDKAVISEVEAVGFKLETRSALLAHAADDHTLAVRETGIRGKTDQFILKFRKPKK